MNYEEAVAYIEETPKFTTKTSFPIQRNVSGDWEIRRRRLKSFMWREPTEKEAPALSWPRIQSGRLFLRPFYITASGDDQ